MALQNNKNPLHGVTLEKILNNLVEFYGWEKLGKHISINCFNSNPSIKSPSGIIGSSPQTRYW